MCGFLVVGGEGGGGVSHRQRTCARPYCCATAGRGTCRYATCAAAETVMGSSGILSYSRSTAWITSVPYTPTLIPALCPWKHLALSLQQSYRLATPMRNCMLVSLQV